MKLWSRFCQTPRFFRFGWVAWVSLVSAVVSAQTLRDPTLPPPSAAPVVPSEGGKPVAVQSGAMAVMVRQGVPYLVVGTRLYAKGQKVGQARIERITETEVWLREDGALQKTQVFGGIERHASTATDAVNHQSKTAREAVRSKP